MAPPRRKLPANAPRPDREFKLRIPADVADWIDAKAKVQARALNRVIINALAEHPRLEQARDLAESVEDIKVLLSQHSARISWLDLSDELLSAVDAVLKVEGGSALQAALDKLRVVRTAMLKSKPKG